MYRLTVAHLQRRLQAWNSECNLLRAGGLMKKSCVYISCESSESYYVYSSNFLTDYVNNRPSFDLPPHIVIDTDQPACISNHSEVSNGFRTLSVGDYLTLAIRSALED
jgi:hypothetical protein